MTTTAAIAAMIDSFAYEYDPYAYDDANDSRQEGLERLERLVVDDPQTVAEMLRDMVAGAADETEAAQGRELLELLQALV